MPGTIEYTGYRRDLGLDATLPVRTSDNQDAPVAYAGLSAFNIPTEISGHVADSGILVIEFSYSDEERGEGGARAVPGYPDLALVLGKETKKIIEIRATNPDEFLGDTLGMLDPDAIDELAAQFGGRSQRVLMRSALIISQILRSMPKEVRQAMLAAARRKNSSRKGAL